MALAHKLERKVAARPLRNSRLKRSKVALVLDEEGLETLITSLECAPVKCGRRIEMLEHLKQLRREVKTWHGRD